VHEPQRRAARSQHCDRRPRDPPRVLLRCIHAPPAASCQIGHPQPASPASQKCYFSPTARIHHCSTGRRVYKNLLPRTSVCVLVLDTSPIHILIWTPLALSHITFTPSLNLHMDTHNVRQLPNQHNMPARRRTQDISMTADASDDSESSPNVSNYNRELITVDETSG
jgi:hypothetical protein